MRMNRRQSRLAGRLLLVSMLLGSLLRAASPADERWKPNIPKVWDEAALADWATPLAGLNRRPTHISADEYYSLTVENLRTYPVYFPGREPDGYWEMLQRVGPQPFDRTRKIAHRGRLGQRRETCFRAGRLSASPYSRSEIYRGGQGPGTTGKGRSPAAAGRHTCRFALGADAGRHGNFVGKLQLLP